MALPALKRLERAFKRVLFAIAARLGGRSRTTAPAWASRTHRVLYLRYDRIGDMIMATGFIRAVATSHPTIELDVLASPSNRSVLDGNPHVRRVHVFDRRHLMSFFRIARTLRRERYDAVIGGMLSPSATTNALMLASGAPVRIGLSNGSDGNLYTIPIPPGPAGTGFVEQIGRTVSVFGVNPAQVDWRYELHLRDEERERAQAIWRQHPGAPRILVNVSAFTPERRWPADRYAAAIRHLRERAPQAAVLVTGDPGDWEAVTVAASGGATAVNIAPVRAAFALVAAADAFVTPDTSLAHAAAALGTPVAILIAGNLTIFAPRGDRIVHIIAPAALATLEVRDVLPGLEQLLAIVPGTARA